MTPETLEVGKIGTKIVKKFGGMYFIYLAIPCPFIYDRFTYATA